MGKFFKDNKIAWAGKASAVYSLWKIYKCLLHQIAREIMIWKTSQKVKADKILNACVRYM